MWQLVFYIEYTALCVIAKSCKVATYSLSIIDSRVFLCGRGARLSMGKTTGSQYPKTRDSQENSRGGREHRPSPLLFELFHLVQNSIQPEDMACD